MATQAQPNFINGANNGSDIITPAPGNHTVFIGADGFFRCKDSAGVTTHLLTSTGLRIECGVFIA